MPERELKLLGRDKLASALLRCDLGALRAALKKREESETTYSYFEQMVQRRGIPEGVGEVASEHLAHRNATLRFLITDHPQPVSRADRALALF